MSWKPDGYREVSPYLVIERAQRTIHFLEALFGATLELGAEPLHPPERKAGDPDRRGDFRDPGGNTWWVATQSKSAAPRARRSAALSQR